MAEEAVTNGKHDPFATPSIDLEGWWLVDALDGKRWLGRLVPGIKEFDALNEKSSDPLLLEDEIVLHPALEVCPNRALALAMIPEQQTQLNPVTKQVESGMAMKPTAVPLSANNFGLIFDAQKNGLPPVRVRRCSMVRLSDFGKEARGMLRKGIVQSLELAKADVSSTAAWSGPREKVR